MNQLIYTSVPEGTLVIAITKQDVVANDWPMSCGSSELFSGIKAAPVFLDLKSLQGTAGITALYEQMANDVRSGTSWWSAPSKNDIEAMASLA